MKTLLFVPLFFSTVLFAQSSSYSAGENPGTTLTNLQSATTIHDISPLLWRFMGLKAADRFELDYRRKLDSAQGYYIQPPLNNYSALVTVVSVDISTVTNGKKQSAHSSNERLTDMQKNILTQADLSSNIELTVRFIYTNYGEDKKIKEGQIAVTVLPETEARYGGGGIDELIDYLTRYINSRYPAADASNTIQNASILFTVAENGGITGIQLKQSTGNTKTDKLLLEALQQMPKWKPAQNAHGKPVKQKIHLAFGGC
jgi:TonB family protein